jgi:hypothetical protein
MKSEERKLGKTLAKARRTQRKFVFFSFSFAPPRLCERKFG